MPFLGFLINFQAFFLSFPSLFLSSLSFLFILFSHSLVEDKVGGKEHEEAELIALTGVATLGQLIG